MTATTSEAIPASSTPFAASCRAFAQLVRLPNVFTALADICLGVLVAHALPEHALTFSALLLASASLYCGGMVWNDFFDRDQDRRERPFRPLPSGRLSARFAMRSGILLLACGVVLAFLAGWTAGTGFRFLPGILSGFLAAAILLYDGWLKRTWAGPLCMGMCRFLNVLLGLSITGGLAWPRDGHLALVVGVYIAGVTWFARTEERQSKRTHLLGAALVIGAALLLALPLPVYVPAGTSSVFFPYLLVGLGMLLGIPLRQAIEEPSPAHVQLAVKRCLLGLIILDAVLAAAFVGIVGLAILLLLAPVVYLGRSHWLYAT